ncbi:MAG: hypothetical protein ABIM30_00375 [candidate division WOR-3 bacterium]
MAYFDIVKGYRDYGTFIIHQFKAASGYNPQPGDIVSVDNNGLINKATSTTAPIATGVVFETGTPSSSATSMHVVLLGQGIIETDNVASGADAPSVGDYVEVEDGVWKKSGGENVPSGIVLSISSGKYIIYKFI